MINKKYAMAYKEVITILSYVPKSDIEKIPHQKIEFYKTNMDKDYVYKIDETKQFKEQKMSEITKAILANIYRDYWATPYQKERIRAKEMYDLRKIEADKREKYDPTILFNNRQVNKDNTKNNMPIKVEKENFFRRILLLIRRNIHKK